MWSDGVERPSASVSAARNLRRQLRNQSIFDSVQYPAMLENL